MEVVFRRKCMHCGGDGIYTTTDANGVTYEAPCPWPECVDGYIACGKIDFGSILEDTQDKVGDVYDKCKDIEELAKETHEICKKILDVVS